MRNIAIILAGGSGKRMGTDLPKQFLPLDGRMVIEHSVSAFDSHPMIDEVAIVAHPDWRNTTQEAIDRNQWRKVTKVIDGGAERYLSSLNAVMAYIDSPDDTNLLLHDAARPWVSEDIITRVCVAMRQYEAVGVAVPATDTVWEVHPDIVAVAEGKAGDTKGFIARIPERRLMWQAQTPQAFRLPVLRDAYQRALQDPSFHATDDCGVVRRYSPGVKIGVVEGENCNRKITFKDDLTRI